MSAQAIERPPIRPNEAELLARHIEHEDGHDLWIGAVDRYGNPVIRRTRDHWLSVRHRVWQMQSGPLPHGRVLVMDCGRRTCVKIEHMSPYRRGNDAVVAMRRSRDLAQDPSRNGD